MPVKLIRPSPSEPIVIDVNSSHWQLSIVAIAADVQARFAQWATFNWCHP